MWFMEENVRMSEMFFQLMVNLTLGDEWEGIKTSMNHLQQLFYQVKVLKLFRYFFNFFEFISGETNFSDLDSISNDDSVKMRASKERIFQLIMQWLGKTQQENQL